MSKPDIHKFIAVDGESYTVGRDHRYVLLAASTDEYEYDDKGLSTVRCLEFLLSLPSKSIKVAFGWNYDVNMILRDVPTAELIRLWKEGRITWNYYRLEWIPGKWFIVRAGNRSAKICDTFGFFQTSFVNALSKWNIQPTTEIESMKQTRSLFDKQMKAEIIGYCLNECHLLVELMDELEIALLSVDLHLNSWVGAGSIASALLRRQRVKDHLVRDSDFGHKVYDAIRRSYFGGRSELFLQGNFDVLYDYDISSAYPHEATKLPSLAGGRWQRRRKYKEYEWAIWDCSWELDSRSNVIMPFPFRASANRGDIYYPSRGRGFYHAVEVKVALALYPDQIKIHGGYSFHPANDEKPFAFIPEMYAYRAGLKSDGHAGEKVLKLGMNAIYGKLAQGFGFRGNKPPFQSYFWAGAITAGTRARILELAATNPDDLVMVATDGIFFRSPIGVELVGGLGGLELTTMNDVFVAQPGVYSADVDGETIGRSRGFFSREIDYDDLRRGFAEHGCEYVGEYESTRFVGLGAALVCRSLDDWRTWRTSQRSLSLTPSRKFVADPVARPIRHLPPSIANGKVSERYRPKDRGLPLTGDELDALVTYIQGTEQPLKVY